jgi:hypothetical protein
MWTYIRLYLTLYSRPAADDSVRISGLARRCTQAPGIPPARAPVSTPPPLCVPGLRVVLKPVCPGPECMCFEQGGVRGCVCWGSAEGRWDGGAVLSGPRGGSQISQKWPLFAGSRATRPQPEAALDELAAGRACRVRVPITPQLIRLLKVVVAQDQPVAVRLSAVRLSA